MNTTHKPLTPAARARKIAAARKRLDEAVALLDEVGTDYRVTPGPTSREDSDTWRAIVSAASDAERARNTLDDSGARP